MKFRYQQFLFLILFYAAVCSGVPLTLSKAQEKLFDDNPDIQIAEMNHDKSVAAITEKQADFYPVIETFGRYSLLSSPRTVNMRIDIEEEISAGMLQDTLSISMDMEQPLGDRDIAEFGLDFNYPLFTGFSRNFSVKAAEQRSKAESMEIISIKNKLSVKLGILYFKWELLEKNESLQEILIRQIREYMINIKNMYESGVTTRAELLKARARLEKEKVSLVKCQNSTDSIKIEICDLLNIKNTDITPVDYPDRKLLKEIPADNYDFDLKHPDLLKLNLYEKEIQSMKNALAGKRLPWLFLRAGYRYGNPGLNMSSDKFMFYGEGALSLEWTAYDGRKNWSKREMLSKQLNIIGKKRELLINNQTKSMHLAKDEIENARRMQDAAEASLEAAEAYSEDLKNQINAGTIATLEYLTSLTELNKSKFNLFQAKALEKTAVLKYLYFAGKEIYF